MRTFRSFAATLGLALALAAVPAAACSPGRDYRVPTNLELAGHADTIVVARVTGAQQDGNGQPIALVIRPLAAVKGPLPEGDIALLGMELAGDDGGRLAGGGLSDPYEFEKAHPQAYAGACIRRVFPLGTTALFFLRTDHEGMWAPAGTAFSRWAEDVPDENAPWVQLARLYAIAAGLPQEDRAPFLEDEREALMARTDEPLARLMAEDIARQLAGPKAPPPDPFEEAFRQPGEESAVEASLRAMRQGAVEAGD